MVRKELVPDFVRIARHAAVTITTVDCHSCTEFLQRYM